MIGFISLCSSFPRAKLPQEVYCTIESWEDTHKCLFKIFKWTAESLNSLRDLTSAANLVNIFKTEVSKLSPIYLCTLISDI